MSRVHNPDSGPECHGCWEKGKQVHPDLMTWFWAKKKKYPNVHISDGYRGPDEQRKAFDEGKSDLLFPHSKHNHTLPDGTHQSLAIDLFQICEDGVAKWSPAFFAQLRKEIVENREPVRSGIKLKSGRIDGPHFQLP